jgi:Ca-activated chloride channel homolog
MLGLLFVAVCMGGGGASAQADRASLPLSVRITSPLGRTGLPGTIRIVAQVTHSPAVSLAPVRFFVNDQPVGEAPEGPPFAVEWADENPFEPTTIVAEVSDALGRTARDEVRLEPFEILETAEVSRVLVEATVVNARGEYVTGMGYSSFRLFEDDEPQLIDMVQPETLPAIYTLLVDSSQSMHRRMDLVRLAAGRLTPYLRAQDRVIVAPFSTTIGSLTGPTDDPRTVAHAISAIRARGGTAILDALLEACRLVRGLHGRNVIVLVTDGYDEHSREDVETVLASIRQTGATVYVIGIGGVAGISLRGERFLKRLAADTGGRAFFPSREEELPRVHELVARDVQLRYLLSYTPSNQRPDGRWRTIAVATANPDYTVRARPGYFAPRPPPVRASIEFTLADVARQPLDVAREDFVVVEDGVEQEVDTFHEAVAPVSIVLALDESGSMVKAADAVREAARRFVAALRPEDGLAVMLFADRAVLAHDLTRARAPALDAIESYRPRGGTALYDALCDAMTRLQRTEGRKVIVLLSDGRDEDNPGTGPGSARTRDEVFAVLQETDAAVFTVGLGPRVDRPLLDRLALESGGESYFPEEVSTLDADYQRIVETLRRRYVIGYTSTNSERDGGWRTVHIQPTNPDTVVRTRGGYFAPER